MLSTYVLRLPHSTDSQINLLRHSEDQPYPYGEQDFNLFYRYSCLHSHFQAVQGCLPLPLRSAWNAFLLHTINSAPMNSVRVLMAAASKPTSSLSV